MASVRSAARPPAGRPWLGSRRTALAGGLAAERIGDHGECATYSSNIIYSERPEWVNTELPANVAGRNGLYGMAILPLVVLPTDRLPMLYRGVFQQFVPEGPLKIAQHFSAGVP